jgi:hypothetical protein
MDDLLKQLVQALLSVLTLVAIIGTRSLIGYLQAKLGEAKLAQAKQRLEIMLKAAESVVAAVEQTRGEDPVDLLKARAINLLKGMLDQIGIEYSFEELDAMIEQAVLKINQGVTQ